MTPQEFHEELQARLAPLQIEVTYSKDGPTVQIIATQQHWIEGQRRWVRVREGVTYTMRQLQLYTAADMIIDSIVDRIALGLARTKVGLADG